MSLIFTATCLYPCYLFLNKVLNKRLMTYLEGKGLVAKNYIGFRRGKSAEDAVKTKVEINSSLLDGGKYTQCILVFLDSIYLYLAKAFDTVAVPILLKRLEQIGPVVLVSTGLRTP